MTPDSWLHWSAVTWLIVDALAVYRLTRIVVRDTILAGFRSWLSDHYEGMLVEWLSCMWCLSVWMAAGVVALTWWIPLLWSYAATALAFSAIAGFLGDRVA